MEMNIKFIWEKYEIQPSDWIIIGVSGWIDSMVLLELLKKIHPSEKIIVCHVNHWIRIDSNQDANFVKEFWKKNWIRCEWVQIDIQKVADKTKISVEMAWREFRYTFF